MNKSQNTANDTTAMTRTEALGQIKTIEANLQRGCPAHYDKQARLRVRKDANKALAIYRRIARGEKVSFLRTY